MNQSTRNLFKPLNLGDIKLGHRIVLPPLTRYRADDSHVPLEICAEYYAQRASVPGTLLIAEATLVSPRAGGMSNVPGIWSSAQLEAWENIVKAVHAKGSYIFLQLWDLGRRACPETLDLEEGGPYQVSSASQVNILPNIPVEGGRHLPPAKAHELTVDEIKQRIDDYAVAAKNAIDVGFDGIEVHGANGYLVDQFLADVCNRRADNYGGSIENRSRFCLELTQAIIAKVGNSKKVAMRLSPWTDFLDGTVADPIPQFLHVVSELRKLDLAYLHLVESRISGDTATAVYHELTRRNDVLIEAWRNVAPIVLAGGYTAKTAEEVTDKLYPHLDVCVAIGRYYLSTPDLPYRIEHGLPLNPYDRSTFYKVMSADGYTDYPYSDDYRGSREKNLVTEILTGV